MRKKQGFTLIEMLVVVLIIGILASIAIPQYFKVVERARVAEALGTFSGIKSAQERHMAKTGQYTTSWDTLDMTVKNSSGADCAGTASCAGKTFTYSLTATTITAKRNSAPTPPARYGTYTITYTLGTNAMTCDDTECTNELL